MNVMYPVSGLQGVSTPLMAGGKVAGNRDAVSESGSNPFKTMFDDALQNVQQLDAIKSNDAYNLAVGDVDDIAEIMTNSERAQAAFQLLVQMRNKIMDSYQEIMRINV